MLKKLQKFKNRFNSFFRLSRLDRPIAILFLLFPCLFGIFFNFSDRNLINLFQTSEFFVKITSLFTLGALIMRTAGCVINDIFDRKIDKKIARTSSRPLANSEISLLGALIFLFILLLLGCFILLQFNEKTVISGFFALILVILYPLMKRVTYFPQIFLGITFNYAILMTSFAVSGQINISIIFLYIACIFWTLIYDTIYGFQDIEDDLKIGVKSTSIKFSQNPKKILTILSFLMLFFLVLAGILNKMSFFYFVFVIFAVFYEIFLVKECNYKNSQDCLRKFKQNYLVGFLILIAVILG